MILVLTLGNFIFLSVIAFRLLSLSFIRAPCDDFGRPSHPVVLISSVFVSVTRVFFFWNKVVSPMSNPQLGGPVGLRSECSFQGYKVPSTRGLQSKFSFFQTDCLLRLTSFIYPTQILKSSAISIFRTPRETKIGSKNRSLHKFF